MLIASLSWKGLPQETINCLHTEAKCFEECCRKSCSFDKELEKIIAQVSTPMLHDPGIFSLKLNALSKMKELWKLHDLTMDKE